MWRRVELDAANDVTWRRVEIGSGRIRNRLGLKNI